MNSSSYIKPTLGIRLFGENIYLWSICLKLLNRVKENIRANESEMCEEEHTAPCHSPQHPAPGGMGENEKGERAELGG